MKDIQVGGRFIGDNNPTYVIAEVGINHNGDLSLAKEMISAAWESGADAVKIQTFITKNFLHPSHPSFQHDADAEITHEQEQVLWDYAKTGGINLFSTPEEFLSLEFISEQNPELIKIASMDFNYKELVMRAAKLKKPIILSSGMSTMEEVLRTVRWVEEAENEKYMILHCVSCYPTPVESCNLQAIKSLKDVINCPVGFSDHTVGTHIAFAAACLGANIIEKHFTLDKCSSGPDQKISMTPDDLRGLVKSIRDFERAKGLGVKKPADEERAPRIFKRRGIYSQKEMNIGDILTRDNVVFYAPSSLDSSVEDWGEIAGRSVKKSISPMSLISLKDVV